MLMDTPSTHQTLEYRSDVRRLILSRYSQNMWGYSLMFGAEHFLGNSSQPESLHQRIGSAISLLTLRQPRAANAASISSVQQPAPPNRCHPLIPRVALRPVRLQRPPVPIVILLLHAINDVAFTTTDSTLPRTPATFLTMLWPAMCVWVNPTAWAIRCAAMRVTRRPRNETAGAKFMAPAMGRPSSRVLDGSACTPPGTAATHCTMSALATPVEQCPAGNVDRLQTLPVANGGHNQQTLQWLVKQAIRMRVVSSRNKVVNEDFPVRRE
ncbi:hypothetical protein MOQ_008993 [Trypanosoma cruzi marinkellei]|uniref:Uncharacterized protein n=1 Tax=Trypanosoma cruzi marinkellei TaxID=85056 RepID=K2NE43_TRYCR|nr:hypothetical protein MOQ_008993 [Trypanosoma cruzi marinkellei]